MLAALRRVSIRLSSARASQRGANFFTPINLKNWLTLLRVARTLDTQIG
jgi:hypothetical protein